MEKIAFTDAVSETLLINLYLRSLENKHPEPILKDEFSKDVVNRIEYDFAKFDRSKLKQIYERASKLNSNFIKSAQTQANLTR